MNTELEQFKIDFKEALRVLLVQYNSIIEQNGISSCAYVPTVAICALGNYEDIVVLQAQGYYLSPDEVNSFIDKYYDSIVKLRVTLSEFVHELHIVPNVPRYIFNRGIDSAQKDSVIKMLMSEKHSVIIIQHAEKLHVKHLTKEN